MRKKMRAVLAVALTTASLLSSGAASALPSVLIVGSDFNPPSAELISTGFFSAVDTFNSLLGTPTLAALQGYSAVLNYSNVAPADPTALGDVLKAYVDGGGGLVIDTYSFSNPFAIAGGITGHGYSPLVNSGTNADPSGLLVAVAASPIFSGVNLSTLSYFHNNNFAVPALDGGATLLATDGAGIDMVAISSSGRIIASNLYPGSDPLLAPPNNADLFRLTANELVEVSSVPEPETYLMMMGGLLAFVVARRRRGA